MKVVQKEISKLHLADYNPRRMTEAQEKELTQSIKEFGLVDPILINSHPTRRNIIIGGHQRVIIAKKLKIKLVDCVEVSLPLERERELNIRLNKNNGEWDFKKLQEGFDVQELLNWGFTKKELEINVADLVDKTKPGKRKVRQNVDVAYQLGDIRFVVPQSIYIKWIDELAKKKGMKKESQIAEIKRRLKIPAKVK